MTRTKKTTLIAAAALLLVSGTAWSMRPGSEGVAPVKRGDVVREVVAPGLIEPTADQVALGFETSGRVVEVSVEEGDRVEAGQLLARLDDRLARAQLARAEAALAGAEAKKDLAFHGARPAEIRAAEADAEAARAQARDRDSTRRRNEKLLEGGAISKAEADGALHASDAARASAAAAEARLDVVKSGERSEVRRDALAAVAAAEADLEHARTLLAQTELRAPRTGVVLRRMVEPGEQIATTPPKVVLTLADVDRLRLRAEVDEADVGRVAVGQSAFVTADAYGSRRFPAHVVRVMRELGRKTVRLDDPHAKADTRVLEVILELDDAAELPLGLRMDAHVQTVVRRDVLVVPIAAVHPAGSGLEVTVLASGKKSPRPIELGADDGVIAEVSRGLTEGENVALR